MKRFLCLISLTIINLVNSLRADSSTTGSLHLTKPSTGVVSGIPPGIKLNTNFDIIDGTVTNILTKTSAVSNDTTTLNGLITGLTLNLSTRTVVGSDEGVSLGGTAITAINVAGAGASAAQAGSTYTITVTATGGASFYGSTQTTCFRIPSAYLSTITVAGFPGAYHSWGPSTATIAGMWATAQFASTVGWVRFDALISTGGLSGLPLAPNRFLPLSLSTGTTTGQAGYTGFISTSVRIAAFETFGVGISSLAVSGIVATGCEFCIDWWEFGRY